jgi:hypothetical protein
MLDAASIESDLQRLFRGRLVRPTGTARSPYTIHEPPDCEFPYTIGFMWRNGHVEEVDVKLTEQELPDRKRESHGERKA